ncbi:MAG: diguanylate cyclase [Solirubrobacteraceae bacterium]|nr:diguanylate cyclase [Solirubrobacteraceae bacterium]
MRRFAPALSGRVSRRDIVLSPHLWSATGAMFAVYAVSCAVIAIGFGTFDDTRLLVLAGTLGTIAVVMLALRPPEPGSLATHAAIATTYLGSAGAVAAYAPHGSATVIAGLFTGPLLSLWIRDRRTIAVHLSLASAALLAAVVLGGGDQGTVFAAVCFIPGTWVLAGCCVIVLDAVEAQGAEYERLAMRDPLTGIGNPTAIAEVLGVELTRHRSSNQPLAVVEFQLDDFARINTAIGRSAGDGVLASVAAVLTDTAPSGSAVARIEGDRFVAVLPGTGPQGAETFLEELRQRLALIDTGDVPLAIRAGVATFPADGTRERTLRGIARDRVAKAPAEHREPGPHGAERGGLAIQIGEVRPIPRVTPAGMPSPEARENWAATRVDRRGIATDPVVWRVTALTFLMYAVLATVGVAIQPDLRTPWVLGFVATGYLTSAVILVARPPAVGTIANHVVAAATWVLPLAAMAACAPHASWAVGTAMFSGVLVVARLVDRRQIAAHVVAFTIGLYALILTGHTDIASTLACLTLVLSTWVIAICNVIVFEAAESQGHRMAELVLRDPLTGAGNERLLRERLIDELPRHRDMQMPLVLIDLQLSGFDALRTHEGRGAADEVLRDVAVLMGHAVDDHATISRIHGHRFRMLLPLTGPDDLDGAVRDLRIAIAGCSRRGRLILPRIGLAAFPEDGVTEEALIAIAGTRMSMDDPRGHDLIGTPDPDESLPIRQLLQPRPSAGASRDEQYAERRRSIG